MSGPLPLTVLIAARNEALNIGKCLASLGRASRVIIVDSHSTDGTNVLALANGAEVVQFSYTGSYPKKRQWALETLELTTPWILLLDADEVMPPSLWDEIAATLAIPDACAGYLITKEFHFLGRRLRFGGFDHSAVLLFKRGRAAFERLVAAPESTLDMEVHERVIVDGRIGSLRTPLIHEDFKGLQAYIDRHNKYSTWEAAVRCQFLETGRFGEETVRARAFGNTQERRRWLKSVVMRLPGEPWIWFLYHYVMALGFLEGRRGWIASRLRAHYIEQVRAKVYERRHRPGHAFP